MSELNWEGMTAKQKKNQKKKQKRKEKKLKEKLDDIKVELEEKKDDHKDEENKENGTVLFFTLMIFILMNCLLNYMNAASLVNKIPSCCEKNMPILYNFYFEFLNKNICDQ